MATPAQTRSPSNPSQQTRASFPPYQPPTTPEEVTREQERIQLLLDINSELLMHINHLQGEGHGVGMGNPAAQLDRASSMEYVACLRTAQANVTYLAIAVQGGSPKNKGTYGPVIMDSPISTPSMTAKYDALRSLFPGWKGGQTARQQQTAAQLTQSQSQGQVRPPSQPA